MSNVNLVYYCNLIKHSVDEDRLQVFWITQKLKSLSLSNKKIYIYSEKLKFVGIKCRDNSENKYDNHQFFAVI